MNKKDKKEKRESEIWRKGYDLGLRTALRDKELAIKIGESIISALDERYKIKEEDY